MTRWLGVVVLGAVLLLAGCGSGGAPATQSPAADSSSAAALSSSAAGQPSAEQRAAFVAALKAVDAGLVAKEDRAVSRGRDVCLDISQGKDAATVAGNAAKRFDVSTAQAEKVVVAARQHLCPK